MHNKNNSQLTSSSDFPIVSANERLFRRAGFFCSNFLWWTSFYSSAASPAQDSDGGVVMQMSMDFGEVGDQPSGILAPRGLLGNELDICEPYLEPRSREDVPR
jgi:hypothetical protein